METMPVFIRNDMEPMGVPIRTVRRTKKKIGRNEPCPCGSGSKFKKCCIKKENP